MNTWPRQSAMTAFYGNPDTNTDGRADAAWEAANLVRITPPYRMVLAWDTSRAVTTILVHRKCSDSLLRILNAIEAHYGTQEALEAARMHLFGGVYNFRLMRGGASLSIHSWGAAIDLDPERNGLGVEYYPARGMMPAPVIAAFAAEGWTWGGNWNRPDAMHFQAATVG